MRPLSRLMRRGNTISVRTTQEMLMKVLLDPAPTNIMPPFAEEALGYRLLVHGAITENVPPATIKPGGNDKRRIRQCYKL